LPAPPPEGLTAFCERRPSACAGAVREDGATIFARLIALRAQRGALGPERGEIVLTPERWRELEQVNREVNEAIVTASDEALFGVREYWTMPLSFAQGENAARQGDCEDHALEKRARLVTLGWRRDALMLAIAEAPDVGMHAVLLVQTDRGDFVLDSLLGQPRAAETLNYRWVARQAQSSLLSWAQAALIPDRSVELAQSSLFQTR
jgi:predicted transglutaminase-like cysteine proteinase